MLNMITYQQPMGQGLGYTIGIEKPEWVYPPPNSVNETMIQAVCNY